MPGIFFFNKRPIKQPWHANYNKRLVKSQKLYFWDTGLAAFLLGIHNNSAMDFHFARGMLFENLIIAELMKSFYNTGRRPPLYFWRDIAGNEVDCLIEFDKKLLPVEIKMGSTFSTDWLRGIRYMQKLSHEILPENSFIIYGGMEHQERSECKVICWKNAYMITDSGNK